MSNNQARDLFRLQIELINAKVDMAVSSAIDRVVQEISGLRTEVHSLRHDMHVEMNALKVDMQKQFSTLDKRVSVVETSLLDVKKIQSEILGKTMGYTFRSLWIILLSAAGYALASLIERFI